MRQFCGKFMREPGDRLFSCGAGHGTCVDAYGNAQICLPLRHPDTVCDLYTGSLREHSRSSFPGSANERQRTRSIAGAVLPVS
jgi:hypothetical protein